MIEYNKYVSEFVTANQSLKNCETGWYVIPSVWLARY